MRVPRVFAPARLLILGLLLAMLVPLAACGGKATSTPSASPSVAAAQIKANWEAFFAGTTPVARKISLLQNGQRFATRIEAQAGSAIAKGSAAKVSAVQLTSPITASVRYSILLNGQVALANQSGQAIKEGGVWKVGQDSFAALLALEGASSTPPSASP